MRISEILDQGMVVGDCHSGSKEELLRVLGSRLTNHPAVVATADSVYESLMNRERLGSTGVGVGVAIPHAKLSGLEQLVGCFVRAPEGVPFDAIDKAPVKLIFALLVPENSAGMHLKALARISRLLKDESFRGTLLSVADGDGLFRAFVDEDERSSAR